MTTDSPKPTAKLSPPHETVAQFAQQLTAVKSEPVALQKATGRILAENVVADRPSPPCSVSAMDGYALRLADLSTRQLSIAGEVAIGSAPPELPEGKAIKIFTGGAVPEEADLIIPREKVEEHEGFICLDQDLKIEKGQFIRRCGENLAAGKVVAQAGQKITAPVAGALASFGCANPLVYKKIKVACIITGNEVLDVNKTPSPWQLRDANGPALAALFAHVSWIDFPGAQRAIDTLDETKKVLDSALNKSDVVILTGGVSMGDYDYVPKAVKQTGGQIIFHKLNQKPGKPLLGAVGKDGQAIIGLPGNPVSALVTARRWAVSALAKRAGFLETQPAAEQVILNNDDNKHLSMWWFRPVNKNGNGQVELVKNISSGDMVSTARSDGFIELPPDKGGAGPWPFYSWSIN